MFPARSISISGSASSRCGSAGTAAENASPCALADGRFLSSFLAVVVTFSVPVYGCGAMLAKPQASASYPPAGRLLATTFSVVPDPSLEPTSVDSLSPSSAASALLTVRISSLVVVDGDDGVHVIENSKVASILS